MLGLQLRRMHATWTYGGQFTSWLSASAACQHQQIPGCVLLRQVAGSAASSCCRGCQQHDSHPLVSRAAGHHRRPYGSTTRSPALFGVDAHPQQHQLQQDPAFRRSWPAPAAGQQSAASFQLPGLAAAVAGQPDSLGALSGGPDSGSTPQPGPHQGPLQQGQTEVLPQHAAAVVAAAYDDSYDAGSLSLRPPWQTKRVADMSTDERLQSLHEMLVEEWDMDPGPLKVGTTRDIVCPQCGNGSHGEPSFAVTVQNTADNVAWCCHRASCGYKGGLSLWRASTLPPDAAKRADAARATLQPGLLGPASQPTLQQPAGLAGPDFLQQQGGFQQPVQQPLGLSLKPLTPELLVWFAERGISQATLDKNRICMEHRYCFALRQKTAQIAFPYFKNGAIVNVKYRALPKHFSQSKGGEQVFYGYDGARGANEIIIVEGEMDKLAIEEALLHLESNSASPSSTSSQSASPPGPVMTSPAGGRRAVVSVPSGAPARESGPAASLERKFKFVADCSDILSAADRIVLAVDSDGPGVVLAGELARRVGREKCYLVTWPTSKDNSLAPLHSEAALAGDWARKDANEVLIKDGPEVLKSYIDAAKPLPVRGLFNFAEFWPQVYDLYQQGPKGLSWGVSTGWQAVDDVYKVVPGELTIVTGLANSGKSEWLDALAVNLAQLHGWRIALCSLENSPKEHGRKLMEKYTRKAFFDADYSIGTTKMEYIEVLDAVGWIDAHFHLIRPPRDQMPSIDFVLDRARAAVLRYGITGLVIDPYNELDHRRPSNVSETEHVSRMLAKVKRFAQHYDCHVWFVAHPRTQRGLGMGGGTSSLSAPSMYDISGSAHFINKADNGIVVHRPYTGLAAEAEGKDTQLVQVLVRKVRNKLAGRIGDVMLRYNRATGCYADCTS